LVVGLIVDILACVCEANLFSGGKSECYYYPIMFLSGIILHIPAFVVNAVLYHVQFFWFMQYIVGLKDCISSSHVISMWVNRV